MLLYEEISLNNFPQPPSIAYLLFCVAFPHFLTKSGSCAVSFSGRVCASVVGSTVWLPLKVSLCQCSQGYKKRKTRDLRTCRAWPSRRPCSPRCARPARGRPPSPWASSAGPARGRRPWRGWRRPTWARGRARGGRWSGRPSGRPWPCPSSRPRPSGGRRSSGLCSPSGASC